MGGPRVQHHSLCKPPPCLPRHQRGPALERGNDCSLPPYAGPLVGLWRGERDEAGRGPLKHTPKGLFMSKPNLTENVYSQARKKQLGEIKATADAADVGAQAWSVRARVTRVMLYILI